MPLPDERPRQSVANLIGKFEQGGKRGSSSNGVGVSRRLSQGVLSSVPPAVPLKAQYTGNSTSAISVQSGPRSPPIRTSELSNTSGTDVPSWRKATALQATVPPATPEITQPMTTLVAGEEPQETTVSTVMEQKVTSEETTLAPVIPGAEQVTSPDEPAIPKPGPEKSPKQSKSASNASSSAALKPKPAVSKQGATRTSKPTAPSTSKTTKSPPVSRPSTLSKATASASAKSSRPSVVPPPAAPLKPQHTGGSTTTNRLSAPTAASKARIAAASSSSLGAAKPAPSSMSTAVKPNAPSSSTVKLAATTASATTSPRKVVPKSMAMAGSTSAPVKKAPLPRSTVSTSKPSTSSSAPKKPAPSATQRTATTSKAPPAKAVAPPRVGLAGAGRVKNPSGPAKLAAAGGLAAGVPTSALLVQGTKETSTEGHIPVDQPQESTDPPVEELQKVEEGSTAPSEIEVEGVQEGGDETVMQEAEVNEPDTHEEPEDHMDQEEPALSETAGHDDAELFESVGHDDVHEGEVSMTLDEDEYHEEAIGEAIGGDHNEEAIGEDDEGVNEAQEEAQEAQEEPQEGAQEEAPEGTGIYDEPATDEEDREGTGLDNPEGEMGQEDGQDHASGSPLPSHTEEEPEEHTSTPSEGEGGGDLEDAVALLEGGHPNKTAQPIDLFSPGYAEGAGGRKVLTQESSPNPSQREVGDIPDDD